MNITSSLWIIYYTTFLIPRPFQKWKVWKWCDKIGVLKADQNTLVKCFFQRIIAAATCHLLIRQGTWTKQVITNWLQQKDMQLPTTVVLAVWCDSQWWLKPFDIDAPSTQKCAIPYGLYFQWQTKISNIYIQVIKNI